MTTTTRPRAAWLALALLLAPAGVRADEPIARRLVALRSLVHPGSVPRPEVSSDPFDCPASAWEVSDYGVRSRTDAAVRDASLRYAVDPALIRSVIRHESAGDPRAVSHKGAMGLMQLMPATASRMGVICPFDPRQNVLGGTRYLRRMRDRLGSWPRAVAAYHAGPRRVESGRIPAVTRSYVRNVMGSWRPRQLAWLALE